MKKEKHSLKVITPEKLKHGDIRQYLNKTIDICFSEKEVVGYAYVAFFKDKEYHTGWHTLHSDISVIDLPEMVKARLMRDIIKS